MLSRRSTYDPFENVDEEIRVLYLDQVLLGESYGFEDYCISGNLKHITLTGNHSPYFALSYVWGDSTPVSAVILDAREPIPIARNLLLALLHIKKHHLLPPGIPIWVDAACIDQSHEWEKSRQVAHMDNIYSNAMGTLIFLGSEAGDSEVLMASLDAIGQRAVEHGVFDALAWEQEFLGMALLEYLPGVEGKRELRQRIKPWNRFLRNILCPDNDICAPTVSLEAIQGMMASSWWTRIWVLQELLLSKTPKFVYGSKVVHAERVVAALKLLSLIQLYIERLRTFGLKRPKLKGLERIFEGRSETRYTPPAVSLYHLRRMLHDDETWSWSIGSILSWISTNDEAILSATNARDYIYGFLGLISELPPNGELVPDYSLTHVEVFTRAMAACFQSSMKYISLTRALFPKKMVGLPSWVPDWTVVQKSFDPYSSLFEDCIGPTPTYEVTTDGMHVLSVTGIMYGVLQTLKAQGADDPLLDLDAMDYDQLTDLIKSYLPSTLLPSTNTSYHVNLLDLIAAHLLSRCDISPYQMSRIQDYYATCDTDADGLWRATDEEPEPLGLADIYKSELNLISDMYNIMTQNTRDTSEEHMGILRWISHTLINRPQAYTIVQSSWSGDHNAQEPGAAMFIGTAGPKVRNGDVLVEFGVEPHVLYVLRPVGGHDGMCELVDRAWIPRLARERLVSSDLPSEPLSASSSSSFSKSEGSRTVFRIC
ncbi:unnamed protein product [Periconia digitata]|uniref:Heterokaryon incompatibility domain-containing protein n=1 Tax=Periconia digitata TaxID=1303443 RepID=A0A9W4XPF6_9PLEO|nr:unnamed protein product [Periconia digitata]